MKKSKKKTQNKIGRQNEDEEKSLTNNMYIIQMYAMIFDVKCCFNPVSYPSAQDRNRIGALLKRRILYGNTMLQI